MSNIRQKFKNIIQFLDHHARKSPKKLFLFELKKHLGLTFHEVNELVNAVCLYFNRLGLKKGDIVALYLENNLEFSLLLLASLRYGAIAFLYPYMLISEEMKRDLSLIKAKAAFIQEERREEFKDYHHPNLVFVQTEGKSFLEELAEFNTPCKVRDTQPEDKAFLYHSSGTAQHPRGIYYSHLNLMALIPSVCRSFQFSEADIHLVILPLAHSAALNYSFLPALMSGSSVILADNFFSIKDDFWEICRTYGVTYIELVPTVLYMLLHLPFDREPIPSLKYVGCGSAPLSEDLQYEFERTFGLPAANLYGLTETGPTHVDFPLSPDWRRGTIGKPLDVNQVVILDKQSRECSPGEKGEIAVRGDNVFLRYALKPEKAAEHFKKGYFCTGDIGYRDEEGFFYFCGIDKNLIIRGGFNIHPDEIDEVLVSHPEVVESKSFGIPNEFFGEQIKSYVVLKENSGLDTKELKRFCTQYLSPIKVPDFIHFVQEIPDRDKINPKTPI